MGARQQIGKLGELAMKAHIAEWSDGSIMSCKLDGMDQSKFVFHNGHPWPKVWMVFGDYNFTWLGDWLQEQLRPTSLLAQMFNKDGNFHCTLFARQIQLTSQHHKSREKAVPTLCRMHTDNA